MYYYFSFRNLIRGTKLLPWEFTLPLLCFSPCVLPFPLNRKAGMGHFQMASSLSIQSWPHCREVRQQGHWMRIPSDLLTGRLGDVVKKQWSSYTFQCISWPLSLMWKVWTLGESDLLHSSFLSAIIVQLECAAMCLNPTRKPQQIRGTYGGCPIEERKELTFYYYLPCLNFRYLYASPFVP